MARQPLRIAMVTTFYPPYNFGGDGIYVQRLARALVNRGHSVEVIHDTDAYRMMSGRAPEIEFEDDGVRVHRLRSPHKFMSSLGVQQLGRPTTHKERLTELLDGRFDVINYHNVSLIGGPGVWKIGTGVKLHTAHEHWLVCPSHILWRHKKERCESKQCLRCVLRHGRPPQLWRATGKMKKDAAYIDTFMMLSNSADANHKRFGFDAPTEIVPSFLPDAPPQLEAATALQAKEERPYFLFVGRLEDYKGLQKVIPHFTGELPADLVIAGQGDYEAALRQQAEGHPSVRFVGQMDQADLRQLYRRARALVTPSLCSEVFPMVVLEAFREGTPIVSPNYGPYPEIIQKSDAGHLYRTPEQLRAALHRIAKDQEHAETLGRQAFAAFAKYWREDVAMAAYFEVIRDAAERRGMFDLVAKLTPPRIVSAQS